MIVFRLSKSTYSHDLSGRGAEKAGGRWNSRGTAVLYTGESRALCTAELAVHLPLGIVPTNYALITIDIPDSAGRQEVIPEELPDGWNASPPVRATQAIGDQFVREGNCLVLRVPSVVIQGDFNYLLNPAHSDFSQVKWLQTEPFGFDERLFMR